MTPKDFDVVVWGATGFTGKWVVKHLFKYYPQSDLRWAIAGRNLGKLEAVRNSLGDSPASIQTLVAESGDEVSLTKLAKRSKVIISTVGPYAYFGSALVKSCAQAGTHYVDLCGEVPWMREMIDAYQTTAKKSGARIVHSCGFDSIPSDMGNYFIQNQAYQHHRSYLKSVRFALLKVKGGVSGGTVHSMLNVMEQAVKDKRTRLLMGNPYSLNPDPAYRGVDKGDQFTAKYSKELSKWTAPFVMSAINTRVVRRSNALLDFRYGQDFSYTETLATAPGIIGFTKAASIASAVAAFGAVGITAAGRKLIGRILPSQGEGPTVDTDNPGFYEIVFNGETEDGNKMSARVCGDADPGYGSTAKILAESAVCLAHDEVQPGLTGGFWTPSSAMGEHLLTRLTDRAGLKFEVADSIS